jgi:hypothetical protein
MLGAKLRLRLDTETVRTRALNLFELDRDKSPLFSNKWLHFATFIEQRSLPLMRCWSAVYDVHNHYRLICRVISCSLEAIDGAFLVIPVLPFSNNCFEISY